MSVNNLRVSDDGLKFIMLREGVRNRAYPDPATGGAPWTIGVGHTGPEVYPGLYWSDSQVMDALRRDVAHFEAAVNRLVTVRLTQHEFDALVDFTFNEGEGNLAASTLLRLLNAGDYEGADKQFARWNLANGHVLGGLVTRRRLEAENFLLPDDQPMHMN